MTTTPIQTITEQASRWRSTFNETGYLIVEDVLNAAELTRLRDALDRVEAAVEDETLPGHLRRYVSLERDRSRGLRTGKVESAAISNIMELPLFDPLFRDVIVHPRQLDTIEAVFGTTEFAFHNLKCICKMPAGEAPFQWHRDLPYLEHTTPNLVTCMLCVDDMTEENGATVICPGSHVGAPNPPDGGDRDMPLERVPAERVTATCPAGSAVLFHVNVIHGGGPNRSTGKRRNVIGIWSGPGCYATTPNRYAYGEVMPRSQDPRRREQIRQTFGI
jgi:ectoine hydroxylase-related dioxygenase (phytanoyl-CoA dioxygenase family)